MMFGISSIGWVHTLGSLPAVPLAIYMFARHGRIVPRSPAGSFYFISMLIGIFTVFLIAHAAVSYVVAAITLLLLLVGYGVGRARMFGRAGIYIETICLSLTVFLLLTPTVSETLRRVPDGHPIVTDLKSPLLIGAQGGLFALLVIGIAAQVIYLRRQKAEAK